MPSKYGDATVKVIDWIVENTDISRDAVLKIWGNKQIRGYLNPANIARIGNGLATAITYAQSMMKGSASQIVNIDRVKCDIAPMRVFWFSVWHKSGGKKRGRV